MMHHQKKNYDIHNKKCVPEHSQVATFPIVKKAIFRFQKAVVKIHPQFMIQRILRNMRT